MTVGKEAIVTPRPKYRTNHAKRPPRSDRWRPGGHRVRHLLLGIAAFAVGCGDSGTPVSVVPVPVKPEPTVPVPTTLLVSPASVLLTAQGETKEVTAEVLDQNDRVIVGQAVEWTSNNSAVASVKASGGSALITAVGVGATVVTAESGETIGQVEVKVEVTVLVATERLPSAYASFEYSTMLGATGGLAPYSWGLSEGALPAGLTLTSAGEIQGLAQSAGLSSFVVRARDASGSEATVRLELQVCGPPIELSLGEVHVTTPTEPGDCGFSLRAASAGSYFRVTLVGTSTEWRPEELVSVEVRGNAPNAAATLRAKAVRGWIQPDRAAGHSVNAARETNLHLRIREAEQRLLRRLAANGRLRPLPDLSGSRALSSAAAPVDTLVLRRGGPGSVTDNCTVHQRITTVLLGFNDHLAIYAEPIPDSPVPESSVAILLRHYEKYGAEVIERWGGVADLDGNGRIIVYLDSDLSPTAGLVWLGDMLPTSACPASNEAELIHLNRSWVDIPNHLSSVLVHEAQHINSVYKRLVGTSGDPFLFEAQHPIWIEEGRALMAEEVASRLAWAATGGPAPHEKVTAEDVFTLSDRTEGHSGILNALSRTKYVFTEVWHSITGYPDPYGGGWHFHRFLGDWLGGAGREPLGDADLLKRLTDTNTATGIEGLVEVTGRSFADLMVDYAVAFSLAGTGSPVLPGVPRFTTYDFTGLGYMNQNLCCWEKPGRFPWPVTTNGEGSDAELWVTLGSAHTLQGAMGSNGLRVHDFRASASREAAIFHVNAPDDVRVVVVRIPDQAR